MVCDIKILVIHITTGHMICYRSQEASQSDDSIEKDTTTITILGDDVSLLDDLLVNAMNVDHVRQQLETLVGFV